MTYKFPAHPVDVLVGKKLRSFRMLRGLRQVQLAKAVGVSFQQIQKYEQGKTESAALNFGCFARFCGWSPPTFSNH